MSTARAIGSNPILFFTRDGRLIDVPISEVVFDDGKVKTTRTPEVGAENLVEWLKVLVERGELRPAQEPPPVDAIVATAFAPGVEGNAIELVVDESAAGEDHVKISVRLVVVHTGLTFDTLEDRLEASGLLRVAVKTAGAPDPAPGAVEPETVGTAVVWTIAGDNTATGKPVNLAAKRVGAGFSADDFTVTIGSVTVVPNQPTTFSLTVEWFHELDGVDLPAITANPSVLDAFKYLVTFSAPPGPGGGYKLPQPKTIKLSGGYEKRDATAAVATLLADG